jgi:hypothetical protein
LFLSHSTDIFITAGQEFLESTCPDKKEDGEDRMERSLYCEGTIILKR